MIRVHLIISGRVQGVGYRSSATRRANLLSLKGWIKNLPNRTVEAIVEGEEHAIDDFINWCYRGPTLAHVIEIKVEKTDATGEFPYFFVRK